MKVKCIYVDPDKGNEGLSVGNIYECSEIDNEGAHVVDDYEDFSFLYTNEFEVIEQ